ncbi:hypothetical protein [Deinococcus maricopensis]|uniref:Lincosamide nucleotidyltransferase-like C-terminal domain-containing protein n=1 Tax=Deinococcus maricopensis (strain DSM 21211 / LMG 22137 / NRRL B-23946 / LB-34) TaxID=709986 RepID=E8U684_DEIML|nr:hypothetical protein [Deinococcus maricopensis]ADV66573.1 hypothetical protein Deima_0919 [Deinococcus maricopensis DSM 21211]
MPTLNHLDALDARVRAALRTHPLLTHALAYGSRTQGPAEQGAHDEYSDLEYSAYTPPGVTLDPFALLAGITPVALAVTNPFGTPNVITPDLVRIELHVHPDTHLREVLGWPPGSLRADLALIRDDSGVLTPLLQQLEAAPPALPDLQRTYDDLLNWLTFASAVLARGEHWRAHELLTWVHGALLRLARAATGAPHRPAPTRLAERDLPALTLRALRRTTPGLNHLPDALRAALPLAAQFAQALHLQAHPALMAALRAPRRPHGAVKGRSGPHHPHSTPGAYAQRMDRMDKTSRTAIDASAHAGQYAVDITPNLDPRAGMKASEPLLQLRVLEHVHDGEERHEVMKNFITPDSASRIDAVLAGAAPQVDVIFPADAPNWVIRFTRLDDGGLELHSLNPASMLPEGPAVTLARAEADGLRQQLRDRLPEILHERAKED